MAQGRKILRQYNKNNSLETASLKYGQVEDRMNDALWDRIMEGTKIPSTWICALVFSSAAIGYFLERFKVSQSI
jgi:hypothetical protein